MANPVADNVKEKERNKNKLKIIVKFPRKFKLRKKSKVFGNVPSCASSAVGFI